MEELGARLARQCDFPDRTAAVPLSGAKLLLRNALFIPLVLVHGFRRLLPPY
jgi:hypothetical protein